MKERETLKLALEALKELVENFDSEQFTSICELDKAKEAIEACEEALANHIPDAENMVAQPAVASEQELIEDLQAKLKWATEQLDANINWEFVASAKEAMLKAAWAEIKELREQEPDYTYPTIKDYEEIVGFEVGDAFKMGWTMARTTNAFIDQLVKGES